MNTTEILPLTPYRGGKEANVASSRCSIKASTRNGGCFLFIGNYLVFYFFLSCDSKNLDFVKQPPDTYLAIIILIIMLVFIAPVQGQNKTDSLINELGKTQHDSIKVEILSKLFWDCQRSNPSQALQYAEQSLEISQANNSIALTAQSVSPEVIASSGDYYKNENISLSWTLGEIATETYSNGSVILTQGFQQPVSVSITGIDLDLLVFLEGPYSGSQMETGLNSGGQIPLSQPYNTAPWNYAGTENVGSIPNANVVDWVLIELRDAASAGAAIPASTIETQAAFLLKNGSVVGLDGSSVLQFPSASFSNNLYAVVWHRNHLGIISANGITESGGVYDYNFSTALTQVYNGGAGYKEIATNVYGMLGGDANADGDINTTDKNLWAGDAGTKGYKATDHNLDVQVNNKDKNDTWTGNISYSSQVPE